MVFAAALNIPFGAVVHFHVLGSPAGATPVDGVYVAHLVEDRVALVKVA